MTGTQTTLEMYGTVFDREGVGTIRLPASDLNLMMPFRGMWVRADTRNGFSLLFGYQLDGLRVDYVRLRT